MEVKNNYCGIDVSSDTLDIYFKNKEGNLQHLQVTNTVSGFRKIIKLSGKETHFVMEATGVYHLNLIFFLKEQNIAFSVAMHFKSSVTSRYI